MAKAVGNYAPSLVEVSLFGIEVEGFSPDSVVTITKDEVTNTHRTAMDGSANVFLNKYGVYRVNVTIQNTSGSNSWLHLIYKLYEKYGADFKMPLSIKDKSGDTTFFSVNTYFENVPETAFTSEVGSSEWTFLCFSPKFTKGGNVPNDALIETLQMLDGAISIAGMFGVSLSGFKNQIGNYVSDATDKLKEMF